MIIDCEPSEESLFFAREDPKRMRWDEEEGVE
jgi:hypothetical protein